jgi:hypothetical protein
LPKENAGSSLDHAPHGGDYGSRGDAGSLSQMVDSRVASVPLKAISPVFKRRGRAEIPLSISGTESEPEFEVAPQLGRQANDFWNTSPMLTTVRTRN